MNWASTKLFTNSTKVIHYHLEANWYELKNSIHEPSSISVVFTNAAGKNSIILREFLEEEGKNISSEVHLHVCERKSSLSDAS